MRRRRGSGRGRTVSRLEVERVLQRDDVLAGERLVGEELQVARVSADAVDE